MIESKTPEDRLFVAIAQNVALVRVEGRGSFKISTPMKDFFLAAIDGGVTTAVTDLNRCVSMDSTFMGVLAGAAGRLRKRAGGRMVLLNLSPKTRSLISTLGLDQIVTAFDAGQTPQEFAAIVDSATNPVPARAESKQTTAETMLEAHQTLTELAPENAPRFKDVLEFLREDLKRRPESAGPAT